MRPRSPSFLPFERGGETQPIRLALNLPARIPIHLESSQATERLTCSLNYDKQDERFKERGRSTR